MPRRRARIPDPNDSATFAASRPRFPAQSPVRDEVRKLIALRKREIVPWLDRKSERRADVLSDTRTARDVAARRRLALHVCVNFGDAAVRRTGRCTARCCTRHPMRQRIAIADGRLEPASLVAWIG